MKNAETFRCPNAGQICHARGFRIVGQVVHGELLVDDEIHRAVAVQQDAYGQEKLNEYRPANVRQLPSAIIAEKFREAGHLCVSQMVFHAKDEQLRCSEQETQTPDGHHVEEAGALCPIVGRERMNDRLVTIDGHDDQPR